jgi:hypothetical protein
MQDTTRRANGRPYQCLRDQPKNTPSWTGGLLLALRRPQRCQLLSRYRRTSGQRRTCLLWVKSGHWLIDGSSTLDVRWTPNSGQTIGIYMHRRRAGCCLSNALLGLRHITRYYRRNRDQTDGRGRALSGAKLTSQIDTGMSAFDPKRTFHRCQPDNVGPNQTAVLGRVRG